jgi:lipid A 3-O-deacylase
MPVRLRGVTVAAALLAVAAVAPAAAQDQREVFHRLGPFEVLGDGPSYAELGLGVFEVFEGRAGDDGQRSAAAHLQLRWGRKLFFLGPAIGVMANAEGGVYGYGGAYADVAVGRFVVTPLLGLGGYSKGNSKDLGGVFQFRTEVGVAYQLDNGMRVGLRLTHISNADTHDDNPGEEELYLTFALPL